MFLARAVCSFSSTVALKPIEMRIIVAWQMSEVLPDGDVFCLDFLFFGNQMCFARWMKHKKNTSWQFCGLGALFWDGLDPKSKVGKVNFQQSVNQICSRASITWMEHVFNMF